MNFHSSAARLANSSYRVLRIFRSKSDTQHRYFSAISPLYLQASKHGGPIIDFPDMGPPIPEYTQRQGESLDQRRARLFYQSRKRGMSENGLLLSTFASLNLYELDENLLEQYDTVINKPTNDWEIFYWMTEKKPTPKEYDNEIMDMLKKHAKNERMEMRHKQPDLDEKTTPVVSTDTN